MATTPTAPLVPPALRPAPSRSHALAQWRPAWLMRLAARLGLLLAVLVAIGLGFWPVLTAPAPLPATAPATEFSAERALQHVRVIAAEPHPMGSPEHDAAVAYLVDQLAALGLQPEVQRTSVATMEGQTQPGVNAVAAGTVNNIVARLPGTASTGAILLIGNYDSMPTTPGAGDPVSGGAMVLETVRALKAGPALQNDVIVAFIDVEPAGLIGDIAFAREHPWGRDASVALAFPALGLRGPTTLFFATGENGRLMTELFDAAPYPLVYSALTDLMRSFGGVFLHEEIAHGAAGLEFTTFREIQAYHTMRNDVDRLDPRLLQHTGGTALGLTRRLGELPLGQLAAPDEVFFTAAPGRVVHYPAAWAPVVTGLVGLVGAGVVFLGFRRRQLSIGGLIAGLVAFPLNVAGVLVLVTLVWNAIKAIHPNHQVVLLGTAVNANVYYLGLLGLAVALTAGLYGGLGRRVRLANLAAGALLWWAALMGLTSLALPGVSYLFTWPLLAGLLVLGWTFWSPGAASQPGRRAAALAFGALPVLLLVTPLFPVLTALKSYFEYPWMPTAAVVGGLAFVPVALALGLLVPHLGFLTEGRRWLAPVLAALAGFAVIGFGLATSRFDAEYPRPNSIAYLLDADTGEAAWASGDAELDGWTSQFFTAGVEPAGYAFMPDLLPNELRPGWRGPAPTIALAAPEATVLEDTVTNGVRRLRLQLSSPRGASDLVADLETTGDMAVALDGKPIDWEEVPVGDRNRLHLAYHALPAGGIELEISAPAGPVGLRLQDLSNGLPEVPGLVVAPRPPELMPAMYLMRDPTIVTRAMVLE